MQIATKLFFALLMCLCSQLAPAYGSDDTVPAIHPRMDGVGDFDPPGGIDYRQLLLNQPRSVAVPRLIPNTSTYIWDVMKQKSQSDTSECSNSAAQTPTVSTPTDDPDTSKELKTAWELWRGRVSEAMNARFDDVAERSSAQYFRPMSCQVAYSVGNDRRIFNIRMLRKSDSIVFNSMLFMVLNSMNGNAMLEFPAGSKRQSIEMNGTFSRNGDRPGGLRFLNDSADVEKKR